MRIDDILVDAFGRVRAAALDAIDGLSTEQLSARVGPEANPIGWLVWHLTRVQDDHVAAAVGIEQVWTAQGWAERFDLPFDPSVIGYGQSSDEVAQVRVDADRLRGYLEAVHAQTVDVLHGLSEDDLDRVVDERWDPPVTYGVRLVSVIADDLQHAGQAAYVRGVLESRG